MVDLDVNNNLIQSGNEDNEEFVVIKDEERPQNLKYKSKIIKQNNINGEGKSDSSLKHTTKTIVGIITKDGKNKVDT